MNWLTKLFQKKKKEPEKLPWEEETEKEFIAEFSGHKFYKLPASPHYCNLRFFYFIEYAEQLKKNEGFPNAYFYAIADQLEATPANKLEKSKGVLAEWMRLGLDKRGFIWFFLTLAIIEAFILVDDEDILKMSNSHNNLKRKIFTANPDARFFFTNLVSIYLDQLESGSNGINLESILNETIVHQDLIVRIMSHLTSDSFGRLMPKNPVE